MGINENVYKKQPKELQFKKVFLERYTKQFLKNNSVCKEKNAQASYL